MSCSSSSPPLRCLLRKSSLCVGSPLDMGASQVAYLRRVVKTRAFVACYSAVPTNESKQRRAYKQRNHFRALIYVPASHSVNQLTNKHSGNQLDLLTAHRDVRYFCSRRWLMFIFLVKHTARHLFTRFQWFPTGIWFILYLYETFKADKSNQC